jgi:hypothetical protein
MTQRNLGTAARQSQWPLRRQVVASFSSSKCLRPLPCSHTCLPSQVNWHTAPSPDLSLQAQTSTLKFSIPQAAPCMHCPPPQTVHSPTTKPGSVWSLHTSRTCSDASVTSDSPVGLRCASACTPPSCKVVGCSPASVRSHEGYRSGNSSSLSKIMRVAHSLQQHQHSDVMLGWYLRRHYTVQDHVACL